MVKFPKIISAIGFGGEMGGRFEREQEGREGGGVRGSRDTWVGGDSVEGIKLECGRSAKN